MVAVIMVASVPPSTAFSPRRARSERRSGADAANSADLDSDR